MTSACGTCGWVGPEGARFCMQCGAQLVARSASREARKVVTVMFSDVTGFTPMSERLDSEALHAVMDRYYTAMREVIERNGGRVERFIGDAVMAVFGLPVTREDDAVRALRAATQIGAALESVNRTLPESLSVRLTASTGINTGEIFVTGELMEDGSGELLGDAVNVAARLEGAAEPGEVLIGEHTYRLAHRFLHAERLELSLKGKADVVSAYRLRSLETQTDGSRTLSARTVGRRSELALVLDAFERSCSDGGAVLATVTGEPGSGKSRIVRDAVEAIGARARIVSGRCLPYGEATVFWPLAEITCRAAGIPQDEQLAPATAAIASLLSSRPGDHELAIAARLAGAFGIGRFEGDAEELNDDFAALFRALAGDRALVAVIEDVHWGGAALLEPLERLAIRLTDTPLLLLCTARPELRETRPTWAEAARQSLEVHLPALGEEDVRLLVSELLGHSHAASTLAGPVTEVANGNPLVVEEVLAMLVDDGALRRTDLGWELAEAVEELRIPPTIEAILAARLDRLDHAERELLEAASVVGKEFDTADLAPLVAGGALEALPMLVNRQLLDAPPAEGDGYQFHHILVRDAAYTAIPKRRRAELHERFGEHIDESPGARREGPYGEIAGEHLERCCILRRELGVDDARTRTLARRAALLLESAGGRAQGFSDFRAAVRIYERGRDLLTKEEPLRCELAAGLAEAYADIGRMEDARVAAGEAVGAPDDGKASGVRARAAIILAECDFWHGGISLEAALSRVEEGARDLEEIADERSVWGWMAASGIAALTARFAEGVDAAEHAITIAERLAPGRLPYCLVGFCASMVRSPAQVEVAMRRALDAHGRVRPDTVHAAMIETQLAYLDGISGRLPAARSRFECAISVLRTYGAGRYASQYLYDWGCCEMLAGNHAAALACFEDGRRAVLDLDAVFPAEAAALRARALARLGRHAEAWDVACSARDSTSVSNVEAQVWWRLAAALAATGQGRAREAELLAREALAIAERTQAPHLRGDTLSCAGEVMLDTRRDEAVELLGQAIAVYEAKGITPGAVATRRLLDDRRITVG